MRLIFTAAITSATVNGLLGAYSMLPSKTTDDDFAVHYLRLARNAPDDLQTVIASALPSCLSNGGRSSLEDTVVAELVARTLLRSGVLMAEGKNSEQSAEEFIPWILKQAASLEPVQKETYLALVKGELSDSEAILCVNSSIRASIGKGIDLKARAWDIRT